MFYCERCRVAKNLPIGTTTSVGACELCLSSPVRCHVVNSKDLPKPKITDLDMITAQWETTNARRCELINKQHDFPYLTLSDAEQVELANLQRLATIRADLIAPIPDLAEIHAIVDKSCRRWNGSRDQAALDAIPDAAVKFRFKLTHRKTGLTLGEYKSRHPLKYYKRYDAADPFYTDEDFKQEAIRAIVREDGAIGFQRVHPPAFDGSELYFLPRDEWQVQLVNNQEIQPCPA